MVVDRRVIRKWKVRRVPRMGVIIRDYLLKGPAYPYEVWRHYLEELKKEHPEEILVKEGRKPKAEFIYHAPIYPSFYRYFYVLHELGLIRPYGNPQYGRAPIPRQRYEIVPERKDSPLWRLNLQPLLYPTTTLRRHYAEVKRRATEAGLSVLAYIIEVFLRERYGEITEDVVIEPVPEELFYVIDGVLATPALALRGITFEDDPEGFREFIKTVKELHRTTPHVRRVKRPAEVLELQRQLEACKRELERVRIAPPLPPPLREYYDRVVSALERAAAEESHEPIGMVIEDFKVLAERFDELTTEEKEKLCESMYRPPPSVYLAARKKYPEFYALFKRCEPVVKEIERRKVIEREERRRRLERAIDTFIRIAKEARTTAPFMVIAEEITIIKDQWEIIPDTDKEEICTALMALPRGLLGELWREIPDIRFIIDKCVIEW